MRAGNLARGHGGSAAGVVLLGVERSGGGVACQVAGAGRAPDEWPFLVGLCWWRGNEGLAGFQ